MKGLIGRAALPLLAAVLFMTLDLGFAVSDEESPFSAEGGQLVTTTRSPLSTTTAESELEPSTGATHIQMRTDLNELPEMKKAKELESEGKKEREEKQEEHGQSQTGQEEENSREQAQKGKEGDTMRGLSRMEEELRQKEAEEERAEGEKETVLSSEKEAAGNKTETKEQNANKNAEEGEGRPVEPEVHLEDGEIDSQREEEQEDGRMMAPKAAGLLETDEKENEGQERKQPEGKGQETEEDKEGEQGQEEQIKKTGTTAEEEEEKSTGTRTSRPAVENEEASDPFQTSWSTNAPSTATSASTTVRHEELLPEEKETATSRPTRMRAEENTSEGKGGQIGAEQGEEEDHQGQRQEGVNSKEEDHQSQRQEEANAKEEHHQGQRQEGVNAKEEHHQGQEQEGANANAREEDTASESDGGELEMPGGSGDEGKEEGQEHGGGDKLGLAGQGGSIMRTTEGEGHRREQEQSATTAMTEELSVSSSQPSVVFPTSSTKASVEEGKEEEERGQEPEQMPDPHRANIQHMSHEGEGRQEQEKVHEGEKSGISSTPNPSPVIPLGNAGQRQGQREEHGEEGSKDGGGEFELISRQKAGEEGGLDDAAEEAEAEVLATTVWPGNQQQTGAAARPEEDQPDASSPTSMSLPSPSPFSLSTSSSSPMSTTEVEKTTEAETEMMEMSTAHGQMATEGEGGPANPEEETGITSPAEPDQDQQQQTTADTPPQRGDFPSTQNGEPIEASTTPAMGTTAVEEDKDGMDQGQGSTGEPMPGDEKDANNNVGEEEELPTTSMSPEQRELAMSHAIRTPFSIRLSDIEWRPEFENLESGDSRKLVDQLSADLRSVLSAAVGPANFLDWELVALRKGSVLLEGQLLTRQELIEPAEIAAALEKAILAKGGLLGGNPVDTDQLSVAGTTASEHAAEGAQDNGNSVAVGHQKQHLQDDAASTGMIIGGAVLVGVLIVVFAVFAIVVFGVNSRRNNGSMKLKEEICMVENGKGQYSGKRGGFQDNGTVMAGGDTGGVNLTSLRVTNGGAAANGSATQPSNGHRPILESGSQFSSPGAYNVGTRP